MSANILKSNESGSTGLHIGKEMRMNYVDAIVIGILALFMLLSYQKGLVISLFNLVSWIIGLVLTNLLYPFVSKMLRTSFLYTAIQDSISVNLGTLLDDIGGTIKFESDLINSLPVPDFMKTSLLENNNSEIYNILNASDINTYINAYIANMAMNVIAMVGVFVVVMVLLQMASTSLNILTKLPVINSMNKIGGAFVGFLQATLVIWLGMLLCFMFFTQMQNPQLFQDIEASIVAIHFYNNNLILEYILKIFA